MERLVSLAALAELAAFRCWPVRCFVLWLLRMSESIAEEFVFEATGLPPSIREIDAAGSAPGDALALAARFYALAAALGLLLSDICRFDGPLRSMDGRRAFARGARVPGSGHRSAGWTLEPHDTS